MQRICILFVFLFALLGTSFCSYSDESTNTILAGMKKYASDKENYLNYESLKQYFDSSQKVKNQIKKKGLIVSTGEAFDFNIHNVFVYIRNTSNETLYFQGDFYERFPKEQAIYILNSSSKSLAKTEAGKLFLLFTSLYKNKNELYSFSLEPGKSIVLVEGQLYDGGVVWGAMPTIFFDYWNKEQTIKDTISIYSLLAQKDLALKGFSINSYQKEISEGKRLNLARCSNRSQPIRSGIYLSTNNNLTCEKASTNGTLLENGKEYKFSQDKFNVFIIQNDNFFPNHFNVHFFVKSPGESWKKITDNITISGSKNSFKISIPKSSLKESNQIKITANDIGEEYIINLE